MDNSQKVINLFVINLSFTSTTIVWQIVLVKSALNWVRRSTERSNQGNGSHCRVITKLGVIYIEESQTAGVAVSIQKDVSIVTSFTGTYVR